MGNASRRPGDDGFETPLVVEEASERFFQKTSPEGPCDERADSFEHLGRGGSGASNPLPGAGQARKEHGRQRPAHSRTSKRILQSGQAAIFDHEASFATADAQHKDKAEPLLKAVRKGDASMVQQLLLSSAKVDQQDSHQQTPLFWAAKQDDVSVLLLLLEAKACAVRANLHGYTPLTRALRHGCVQAAEELLRRHADIGVKDKFGRTALQIAAGAGQIEAVEWLLQHADAHQQVSHHDVGGGTALISAVKGGHAYVGQLLLDAGAPADGTDEAGRSPLCCAMMKHDLDMVSRLLAAGSDVNAADERGHTVLQTMIRSLSKNPSGREAILCQIAIILEAKADPEAKDEQGSTAIILAARAGDATLCAILAAYGADVSVADDSGTTALNHARKNGYTPVCRVLADFGIVHRLEQRLDLNRLLLRACYYGNAEACRKLLERGANLDTRSNAGQSLKEISKSQGLPAVLRLLKDQERASSKANSEEEEAEASSGSEGDLSLWIDHLRDLGKTATALQAAARAADAQSVIAAIEKPHPQPVPAEGSATKLLIAEHAERWRDMMIQQAHSELRAFRASDRRKQLEAFGQALLAWARPAKPESTPKEDLHALVAEGTAAIRNVEISEFERRQADAHETLQGPIRQTYKMEALQKKEIEESLRHVSALLDIFSEESAARRSIPKELDAGNATKATQQLEAAGQRFVQNAGLCKQAFSQVRTASKTCRKLPQVAPTLSGCMSLLRDLHKVFLMRGKACKTSAAELTQQFEGGSHKASRKSGRAGGG
mmetsp:Transcript_9564/g.17124  ORF Transcript_9564/g.17124 Transcript_9564/m.17124 type:complete len:778 (+) Transcript_9564:32-2365(+)|eukprot:CAMPEP_0197655082 /NCGR_PEP_ID=MMETSP1338-20131121/39235_1 /TAXON_ID=43686 ORGANISM="Pelagodinium beii, Strain RCC1491" /NCGR_SAMPLE_ID=MMETSP1338 /ASSEMBLY_ACC=CAM_ASM_000754 /LENGTH=777 /DNA_ID=CAMNT_0043230653 /DNA_START=22 /DNA_END=2355 /DNA_ORIENTATION=-